MSDPERPFKIPAAAEIAALDPATLNALTALCLSQYEPGFLPSKVFVPYARLGVLSTVEVVPLMHDEEDGRTKVLLTRRPETNDWWSGQLHVPGVVALATDKKEASYSYRAPISRLFREELGGAVSIVGRPQILRGRFAGDPEVRARESTLIHWAEVAPVAGVPLPKNAAFYDVEQVLNEPPKPFISAHNVQVLDAWACYEEYRASGRLTDAAPILAGYRGQ
jgi:hypothetical protein